MSKLFPWQIKLMQETECLYNKHLIYSAPTGSGKTMVAELLMFRMTMLQEKKAIFMLPYISVVSEKEKYFTSLVRKFNRNYPNDKVRVKGVAGEMSVHEKSVLKADIIVCTIEKGVSILNNFIDNGKLNRVGIVVVDEMHAIGGAFNGPAIENMLTKLKYIETLTTLGKRQQA